MVLRSYLAFTTAYTNDPSGKGDILGKLNVASVISIRRWKKIAVGWEGNRGRWWVANAAILPPSRRLDTFTSQPALSALTSISCRPPEAHPNNRRTGENLNLA
ncbi:hypothetical protein PM082_013288 [Marasmius tenuissimus]|nr:hypothetical protein PM082_013288 [Marasmius tenuissimus]